MTLTIQLQMHEVPERVVEKKLIKSHVILLLQMPADLNFHKSTHVDAHTHKSIYVYIYKHHSFSFYQIYSQGFGVIVREQPCTVGINMKLSD